MGDVASFSDCNGNVGEDIEGLNCAPDKFTAGTPCMASVQDTGTQDMGTVLLSGYFDCQHLFSERGDGSSGRGDGSFVWFFPIANTFFLFRSAIDIQPYPTKDGRPAWGCPCQTRGMAEQQRFSHTQQQRKSTVGTPCMASAANETRVPDAIHGVPAGCPCQPRGMVEQQRFNRTRQRRNTTVGTPCMASVANEMCVPYAIQDAGTVLLSGFFRLPTPFSSSGRK